MKPNGRHKLRERVQIAANIIEGVDEKITNHFAKSQYGSEDYKQTQRISNALLNVIRAIDNLKYEL